MFSFASDQTGVAVISRQIIRDLQTMPVGELYQSLQNRARKEQVPLDEWTSVTV